MQSPQDRTLTTGEKLCIALSQAKELDRIRDAAEAELTRFEEATKAARASERKLFELLFNEDHGLKQYFGPERNPEARRIRALLNRRAQEAAEVSGYRISTRFALDGELDLSAPGEAVIAAGRTLGKF